MLAYTCVNIAFKRCTIAAGGIKVLLYKAARLKPGLLFKAS
ncbi:hypothetical protein RG47T_3801 [Mucilaginibacter polytrichastri]|uniref:Uncharacterized protein n=1 Tax=Mucilaginibacter polytrichastri TaxID=1302689 RepID=A0A1Q6A2U1_9SPHI|nr:hypothetical protein RG47T_3801 [Mucilaginibacter polytrichastri]